VKLCRYDDNKIGVVRDDGVHDVSAIIDELPAARYPYPKGDALIANLDRLRPKMESLADKAKAKKVSECRFLSPVANPTKVIGTPTNYRDHIAEMTTMREVTPSLRNFGSLEQAGLFLKANSSLVGMSEGVAVRFPDRRTDHEAELGIVFGKQCTDTTPEKAFDCVAGYSMALDMVVRGSEDRSFRKSIDTYSLLGPWLVTKDEFPDPDNIAFHLTVNGEMRQDNNTKNMIMDCANQIAWATRFYTLWPGDVLMTGTPSGVGRVVPGDTMHFVMEGVGEIDIPIRTHGAGK
jgi:2-keto-4-pentenoate hydratase/2-oxohepta-3-ene-1,7-dioic acid hydratase in catechol pathway